MQRARFALFVVGAALTSCGPERAVVRWEDATETIRPNDEPGFGGPDDDDAEHQRQAALGERDAQKKAEADAAEKAAAQLVLVEQQKRDAQKKAEADAAEKAAAQAALVEQQKRDTQKKAEAEAVAKAAAQAALVEQQKRDHTQKKADADAAAKAAAQLALVEQQKRDAQKKAEADVTAKAAAQAALVEQQKRDAQKKAEAEAAANAAAQAALVEQQKRDTQKKAEAEAAAKAAAQLALVEQQKRETQQKAEAEAAAKAAAQAALLEQQKRDANAAQTAQKKAATTTAAPVLPLDGNVVCLVAADALTMPADALARFDAAARAQGVVPTNTAFVVVRSDPARSLQEPPPLLCRSTQVPMAVRSPLLSRDNVTGACVSLQTTDVVVAAGRIRSAGGRELRVLLDERGQLVDVVVVR